MQLTVEQCQRAMSALDKIWESLPRSDRSERKEEREYIRDVLAASQANVRTPPRLRQPDPAASGEGGDSSASESDDDGDEDASPFEVIANVLMSCDPEDEREEVWEQAEQFMRSTRLSDDARAEVLYMLSVFHCVECGAEKSRDPNEPHVCEEGEDDEEGDGVVDGRLSDAEGRTVNPATLSSLPESDK